MSIISQKTPSRPEALQLYAELRAKLLEIATTNNLLDEQVVLTGRDLTVAEAIGIPKRQDFPLQKGKEKLLQASFKGALGQAFTDQAGYFHATLKEIIHHPLESNFNRAVFIATLNAVLRSLGMIEKTIHCKNEEPEECATQLVPFIKAHYGTPKIALVGLQPALLDSLATTFTVRVLDLNPDTIGTTQKGIKIEDGERERDHVLDWCDLILATGSIVSNGTIGDFLHPDKPSVFYGTTVAGAAYLMGWNRFCACSK